MGRANGSLKASVRNHEDIFAVSIFNYGTDSNIPILIALIKGKEASVVALHTDNHRNLGLGNFYQSISQKESNARTRNNLLLSSASS